MSSESSLESSSESSQSSSLSTSESSSESSLKSESSLSSELLSTSSTGTNLEDLVIVPRHPLAYTLLRLRTHTLLLAKSWGVATLLGWKRLRMLGPSLISWIQPPHCRCSRFGFARCGGFLPLCISFCLARCSSFLCQLWGIGSGRKEVGIPQSNIWRLRPWRTSSGWFRSCGGDSVLGCCACSSGRFRRSGGDSVIGGCYACGSGWFCGSGGDSIIGCCACGSGWFCISDGVIIVGCCACRGGRFCKSNGVAIVGHGEG
mmetsp:Transcript_40488/g.66363  ORF Transcript_40488/g.66363 Transcript_40488/m.66363 type:complete len:260 (-) Transcript_40488:59-838(-)